MKAIFLSGFILLGAFLAPHARAQSGPDAALQGISISVPSIYVPDTPTDPLVPATRLNQKFPLRVVMLNGNWQYNHDHESKGDGVVLTEAGQLWYKYRCAWSFIPEHAVYQARWQKPGEKLEILMAKPNQHRATTCTLNTHS